MPKVSIVITCYNLGAFLEEALQSALAQTHPDFEVIVVDDGSTDAATVALLDRLPAKPCLRVLRTANQGVARARNYGITQSYGDYILPLDADDRILPSYLARAASVLDQQPEVGFVGCHFRTFGEQQLEYTPSNYSLPDLLVENVVPIASLFRRRCWEQVGGYASDVSFEDWDLWLGILELGFQGYVLPEILFEYRTRPHSRNDENRQPDSYRSTLELIRERHRGLYDRYHEEVLTIKDYQFARLLAHSQWLDDQRHAWERVAQERLEIIDVLNTSHGSQERRRMWWWRQRDRWRHVMTENHTTAARVRALADGAARIMRRRLRQYALSRLPQVPQATTAPDQQLVTQSVPVPAETDLPQPSLETVEPDIIEAVSAADVLAVTEPAQALLYPIGESNDGAQSQVQDLAQAIQQWSHTAMPHFNPPVNVIELEDFYPIDPVPRYGYGKPFPPKILDLLNKGLRQYKQTLESFLPFLPQLAQIARDPNPKQAADPAWINGFLPGLDSLSLFSFVSTLQPKLFLEIGSGNSTKFAAKAKALNSPHTRIVSIDPYPRVEIDQLCDEVIRSPLESVDLRVFDQLSAGDVLFFDGSHRVFQNSDVTVFFVDILPYLPRGVYIHLHDILWPNDYPPGWEKRYYSEQYLLAMLLLFGIDHFDIILPNSFIAWQTDLTKIFDDLWNAPELAGIERHGGSFWMCKI